MDIPVLANAARVANGDLDALKALLKKFSINHSGSHLSNLQDALLKSANNDEQVRLINEFFIQQGDLYIANQKISAEELQILDRRIADNKESLKGTYLELMRLMADAAIQEHAATKRTPKSYNVVTDSSKAAMNEREQKLEDLRGNINTLEADLEDLHQENQNLEDKIRRAQGFTGTTAGGRTNTGTSVVDNPNPMGLHDDENYLNPAYDPNTMSASNGQVRYNNAGLQVVIDYLRQPRSERSTLSFMGYGALSAIMADPGKLPDSGTINSIMGTGDGINEKLSKLLKHIFADSAENSIALRKNSYNLARNAFNVAWQKAKQEPLNINKNTNVKLASGLQSSLILQGVEVEVQDGGFATNATSSTIAIQDEIGSVNGVQFNDNADANRPKVKFMYTDSTPEECMSMFTCAIEEYGRGLNTGLRKWETANSAQYMDQGDKAYKDFQEKFVNPNNIGKENMDMYGGLNKLQGSIDKSSLHTNAPETVTKHLSNADAAIARLSSLSSTTADTNTPVLDNAFSEYKLVGDMVEHKTGASRDRYVRLNSIRKEIDNSTEPVLSIAEMSISSDLQDKDGSLSDEHKRETKKMCGHISDAYHKGFMFFDHSVVTRSWVNNSISSVIPSPMNDEELAKALDQTTYNRNRDAAANEDFTSSHGVDADITVADAAALRSQIQGRRKSGFDASIKDPFYACAYQIGQSSRKEYEAFRVLMDTRRGLRTSFLRTNKIKIPVTKARTDEKRQYDYQVKQIDSSDMVNTAQFIAYSSLSVRDKGLLQSAMSKIENANQFINPEDESAPEALAVYGWSYNEFQVYCKYQTSLLNEIENIQAVSNSIKSSAGKGINAANDPALEARYQEISLAYSGYRVEKWSNKFLQDLGKTLPEKVTKNKDRQSDRSIYTDVEFKGSREKNSEDFNHKKKPNIFDISAADYAAVVDDPRRSSADLLSDYKLLRKTVLSKYKDAGGKDVMARTEVAGAVAIPVVSGLFALASAGVMFAGIGMGVMDEYDDFIKPGDDIPDISGKIEALDQFITDIEKQFNTSGNKGLHGFERIVQIIEFLYEDTPDSPGPEEPNPLSLDSKFTIGDVEFEVADVQAALDAGHIDKDVFLAYGSAIQDLKNLPEQLNDEYLSILNSEELTPEEQRKLIEGAQSVIKEKIEACQKAELEFTNSLMNNSLLSKADELKIASALLGETEQLEDQDLSPDEETAQEFSAREGEDDEISSIEELNETIVKLINNSQCPDGTTIVVSNNEDPDIDELTVTVTRADGKYMEVEWAYSDLTTLNEVEAAVAVFMSQVESAIVLQNKYGAQLEELGIKGGELVLSVNKMVQAAKDADEEQRDANIVAQKALTELSKVMHDFPAAGTSFDSQEYKDWINYSYLPFVTDGAGQYMDNLPKSQTDLEASLPESETGLTDLGIGTVTAAGSLLASIVVYGVGLNLLLKKKGLIVIYSRINDISKLKLPISVCF